ncbi:unnamed protein product [Rotaria sp. Silwood1]|nr:unnamed protein product [Rotaria sp. Silwood1]
MSWPEQVKFWILLTLSIPSTICSILIFIYFYRKRRNILIHHHLTLILIITSFLQLTTNFPFIMVYYQHGRVISASNSFCSWWNWWEYSTNGVLLFVMAWGSIERHLLVFNRTIMDTKRKRFFYHVLPMASVCIYPFIFYFAIIILNTCKNRWNYNEVFCEIPCYLMDQKILATYDFIADVVFPVCAIAIANISLIFRIVWQKRRHQALWRRQYKLTRQLIFIAVIYTVFWFPLTFNGLVITFTSSTILQNIQVECFFFLLHMVPSLLPFISLTCLSNFMQIVLKKPRMVVVPLP